MPLTFDILADTKPFLNPSCTDDAVQWAAITTGHFLMLRASEFTVPSCDLFDTSIYLTVADANLHSSSDGSEYLTLRIKQSKTDQRRQGVTLYTAHSGHPVCAVCAVKANLAIHRPCDPTDPSNTPPFSYPTIRPSPKLCRLICISAISTNWHRTISIQWP